MRRRVLSAHAEKISAAQRDEAREILRKLLAEHGRGKLTAAFGDVARDTGLSERAIRGLYYGERHTLFAEELHALRDAERRAMEREMRALEHRLAVLRAVKGGRTHAALVVDVARAPGLCADPVAA